MKKLITTIIMLLTVTGVAQAQLGVEKSHWKNLMKETACKMDVSYRTVRKTLGTSYTDGKVTGFKFNYNDKLLRAVIPPDSKGKQPDIVGNVMTLTMYSPTLLTRLGYTGLFRIVIDRNKQTCVITVPTADMIRKQRWASFVQGAGEALKHYPQQQRPQTVILRPSIMKF
jgi:hypothetical protein